jgi:endonuclease/exonuclease/phosphatase family metal-dependent hydrolase
MKLISLNVAAFERNNEKLFDFLHEQGADIFLLQEVVRSIDNSTDPDLIKKEIIDKATPQLNYSFFAPNWILSKFEKGSFHGSDHFLVEFGGKVEFGNYLKTKYKIDKGQNVFVQNSFTYITDWSKWPEEDYRGVQVSDLNIEGKKLRLLNYHGIWSKDKMGTDKTLAACKIIKRIALEIDYPAIIVGDFNLFPDTPSISLFKPELISLVDQYDIKTTRPLTNQLNDKSRNVVDYIFVTKGIKVDDFKVLDSNVSDHLPLILDFEI